jgi:hypothetical protein
MCVLIQLTDVISADVPAAIAGTMDRACSAARRGLGEFNTATAGMSPPSTVALRVGKDERPYIGICA